MACKQFGVQDIKKILNPLGTLYITYRKWLKIAVGITQCLDINL